jgi:hypothetical protein
MTFPLLSAMLPSSCSDFSGFISLLCHPYLPATFSGLRSSLFSFDPPPCYSMLGKNVDLSTQKMSWNSRSKLNFAQCFEQIYIHTQLECTLKKR